MTLTLNAFPIIFGNDSEVQACVTSYDKEKLYELRQNHGKTHTFYRDGEQILCFSQDGNYPISGEERTIRLDDNYWLLSFLFKDGLIRFLTSLGRKPRGYSPIELVSSRPKDNILNDIIIEDFPFAIFVKYELAVRILKGKLALVIDCYTKKMPTQECSYFLNKGFDLIGKYITKQNEYGHIKLAGLVTNIENQKITYQDKDGEEQVTEANKAFLEASVLNLDSYLRFSFGNKADDLIEKIRVRLSVFNSGENKKNKIDRLSSYLKSQEIKSINGISFGLGNALNVTRDCQQFAKPIFIFNDSGEADWAEKGFTQFGPYTKRTFDRNDPSICVKCKTGRMIPYWLADTG